MPENLTVKPEALKPFFAAREEPDKNRLRSETGAGAVERQGRRPAALRLHRTLRRC